MKTVNIFKNLMLVVLFILASCAEDIDPNMVLVSAEVKYEDSNNNKTSVANAKVKVYEAGSSYRNAVASVEGNSLSKFKVQLAPGTYDFVVSKEGSSSDFPPPGTASREGVVIPENKVGEEYELAPFVYN